MDRTKQSSVVSPRDTDPQDLAIEVSVQGLADIAGLVMVVAQRGQRMTSTRTKTPQATGRSSALKQPVQAKLEPEPEPLNEFDTVARDLRLLRAILTTESSHVQISSTALPARRPISSQSTVNTRPPKTTKTRPLPQESKVQSTSPDGPDPNFSSAEQKKLAMDSFNKSLKWLAAAARVSQEHNRITRMNKKDNVVGPLDGQGMETGAHDHAETQTMTIHAECADASLDVLRLNDAHDSTNETGRMKRELAAINLLDKLITLEMVDAARNQASKIHHQYWKRRKGAQRVAGHGNLPPTHSLHNLLHVPDVATSQEDFNMACSFQSQTLRLAILDRTTSLNQALIDVVTLESQSSPAQIILSGHKANFVNTSRAGQDLLILAQALTKLYVTSVKLLGTSTAETSSLVFALLLESLMYKLTAWKILDGKPDLDRELWQQLDRGILQICGKSLDEDKFRYEKVLHAIERVQKQVHQFHQYSQMPSSIIKTLVILADNNHDLAHAEMWVDSLLRTANRLEKLRYTCLITNLRLASAKSEEIDVQSLREVCHELENGVHADCLLDAPSLLQLVRLRKICYQLLLSTKGVSVRHNSDQSKMLQHTCLDLILIMIKFLRSQIDKNLATDEPNQPLCVATLKTVEVVTDAEDYAITLGSADIEMYMSAIQCCLETVRLYSLRVSSLDDVVQKALPSIKIRLSNIYWRAHMRPDPASVSSDATTNLAQQSIFCLDGLSREELSKAALGPRLEKLASLLSQSGNLSEAQTVLERAICHYIEHGALADATEVSLSKRSSTVWTDSASISSQLARSLQSYNSLHLSDNALSLYDDAKLPDIQRAVLLEHQILHRSKNVSREEVVESLHSQARLVLELSSDVRYIVWRQRFVSILIDRLAPHPDISGSGTDALIQLASEALDNGEDCSDVFLNPYQIVISMTLAIQHDLRSSFFSSSDLNVELGLVLQLITDQTSSNSLSERIDDPKILSSILRKYGDKTYACGRYETTALCLKIILSLAKSLMQLDQTELDEFQIRLALCQVRCDDLTSADSSIQEVETRLQREPRVPAVEVKFFLVAAEAQLASCNGERCKFYLKQASEAFMKQYPKDVVLSRLKQIEKDSIIADAVLIASRLAWQDGILLLANQYARQAAKIQISIWAALQRRPHGVAPLAQKDDLNTLSLVDDLSKLDLKPKQKPTCYVPALDDTWLYLNGYVQTLAHAAEVLMHSGLYDDAYHYYKQLNSLASSIGPVNITFESQAAFGRLLAFAGETAKANKQYETIETAQSTTRQICLDLQGCLRVGDLQRARKLEAILELRTLPLRQQPEILEKSSNVQPHSKPLRRGTVNRGNIRAPAKRQKIASEQKLGKTKETVTQNCLPKGLSWRQLESEDLRRAVLKLLKVGNDANGLQTDLCLYSLGLKSYPKFLVNDILSTSRSILTQASEKLRSNSMQSLLAESVLAIPARVTKVSRHGRVSYLQGGGADKDSARCVLESPTSQNRGEYDDITHMLQTAQDLCKTLLTDRKQFCSTIMINEAVKMEARISLLLSTMNLPFATSSTEIVLKASAPKDEANNREMMVAHAESVTKDRSDLSVWPTDRSAAVNKESLSLTGRLDELPEAWSIVSISLAESRNELIISKVVGQKLPFLVRIPLHRSNEGDGDGEFDFDDAQDEINVIIEEANNSSHDVRGTGNKAARSQWHQEREVLDSQLQTLLQNIESIWLGGFRGILSPCPVNDSELQCFGLAFNKILDKHLPSRQKVGAPIQKIMLHDQVLELFLGLGDPEVNDLDDIIIDLLYFVVDILQFSGERNAYDEIDWDAMLVDILDALRVYQETKSLHLPRHTILVLDKELELFPWEALPCLIDHPVSRMPSLGMVFDRLDQIRTKPTTSTAISIPSETVQGSYILNPANNLKPTQDRLESLLASQTLTRTFKSIVGTPLAESEFASLLTTSDILLYFGHGSGAQYIRPRAIRALPRCAVTLLFGCSSAKMSQHGDFESTGMPRAYMLGHSPALVGCLWDVTDREIDRVAVKTLSEWGLMDGEDENVKEAMIVRRGKSKLATAGKKGGGVKGQKSKEKKQKKTLVEAVVEGRKATVLRYLCGAAVVVYGVPVTLD